MVSQRAGHNSATFTFTFHSTKTLRIKLAGSHGHHLVLGGLIPSSASSLWPRTSDAKERVPTVQQMYVSKSFQASQVALVVKNLPVNARDVRGAGSILGLERSPGGGHVNPLLYSCLGIPWTEESSRLQSIGSHKVRHDWNNLACTGTFSRTLKCCNMDDGFSKINHTCKTNKINRLI